VRPRVNREQLVRRMWGRSGLGGVKLGREICLMESRREATVKNTSRDRDEFESARSTGCHDKIHSNNRILVSPFEY